MMTERELEIEELKRLIEILPDLEKRMYDSELSYKRLVYDGYAGNNVGYACLNWVRSKDAYSEADQRRWDLIEKLDLTFNFNGIPDFGESNIKPYGWDRVEIRDFNDQRPISLYS